MISALLCLLTKMNIFLRISVILLIGVSTVFCYPQNDRFFYFAYGSNLLANRIHIQNPSAIFYGIAMLEGYRLDFNMYFPNSWQGAGATIVEEPGSTVWGALWTLDKSQVANLDFQEGVHLHEYEPMEVIVTTPEGRPIIARTYIEPVNLPKLNHLNDLPMDRRPSNTYMQVIILGAIDVGLPSRYVEFLQSFPTNGRRAPKQMLDRLGPPFNLRHSSNIQ